MLIQPIDIDQIDGALVHPRLAGATIGEMREQHLQRGRVDYLEVMAVEAGSNAEAAGFLAGLAQGADDARCAAMGCAAAGEIISHLGARPEADLKALMAGV